MPEYKPKDIVQTGYPSQPLSRVFKRLFQSGRGKTENMIVDLDKNGTPYIVDGLTRTQALIDAGQGNIPVNYKVRKRDIEPPDLSYMD